MTVSNDCDEERERNMGERKYRAPIAKGLDEAMASGYKHANKRLAEVGAEGLVGLTISSR